MNEQGNVCYVCSARVEGSVIYFIWKTDDSGQGQIQLDRLGSIRIFSDEVGARTHAEIHCSTVSKQRATFFEVDNIAAWAHSAATIEDSVRLHSRF
jgi:hypothetical protein